MDKIRFFELVTEWFEVLGVVAMVLGFVFAFVIAGRAWSRTRDGSSAFRTLRETMGAVILLGLEILVAADLVKTVTSSPSLTDAAVLGMIVLIRTVLSLSIQIEIDGVLPWRKALVSSPELLVRAARGSGGRTPPDASSS
ncbi:UNVERIFIED_ORG: putative membrane protein [Rhodococcus erythropolis]